ncbi:hypothetical protein [Roseimaritima ulvae]|uniref:Uncharacterized protein n=1 Tax=Roseimaritima ulvae TaxID=980254 RepID=A0A5B9QWZ9_9BACT|nr:hypothetical protein [Roseimaritima ulvae]QEG42330.1 hypothetical protein UC8_43640 [Roseimaritima ulvae]
MSDSEQDENAAGDADSQDDGVGWLPAVLAFGLLLTAALFVCCGVSTYFLYQKRVELAARTLSGHTIPTIEQSQLEPEDKQAIVEMLGRVVEDAEAGRLENWQAGGVMNRLTRIPILEWGDLAAVEALIQSDSGFDEPAKQEAVTQIKRLRQAITTGTATSFDINEVVAPVLVEDQSLRGRSLASSPTTEQLQEVVTRARLVADRDQVSGRPRSQPSIVELVQREIEAGRIEGSK